MTDEAGGGGTQDVAITIQGTNDGVTITSGAQAGTVAEDAPTAEPDRLAERERHGGVQRR